MVTYIKSDLEFILQQIKIAEDHSLYQSSNGLQGRPLFGTGTAGQAGSIPAYNISWGLRTVDGSYNHLLNPQWGSSDEEFPEGLGTDFRQLFVDANPGPAVQMMPISYTPGVDNDGPTTTLPNGTVIGNRSGPGDVIDPEVRIISNLIVDQTLGNPAAILTALERAGHEDPGLTITNQISAAYSPLKPLFDAVSIAERNYANASAAAAASPNNIALQQAAANALAEVETAQSNLEGSAGYVELSALLIAYGIELDGINLLITNAAPDEGLSAPFNSWFTLFGQFFDHGLDLVGKGGSGSVMIPLMPDDPLYSTAPGAANFMILTRATVGPGPDGVMVDNPATLVDESADNTRPLNTTTAFVDQNQTYTSHASHQVFLRDYALGADGKPVVTGELIHGAQGGMATWADLKEQAADLLGIQLLDKDVGNVPLLLTDPYGEFIRGPNGYPQFMTTTGLVEANPADNNGAGTLVPANALRTGHAFLADIAHSAVPSGLADGDIEIGLGNGDGGAADGSYDNELLDAHYVAGDGRANENIGLTAVHHVFHSEHNRLVEHTKATILQTKDMAFINEWLATDLTQAQVDALPATLPADPVALDTFLNTFNWDGERIFQAAKFGTEMQYQHLVFEEFARKVQPNINVFLVPDGYDVTIDPNIVAEFAHVVYRFGHSMLNEGIERFDPQYNADHIGLIEGFLNPIQFENNGGTSGVDAGISAGAIIRGMTRQVGNEIDEFVTSALRNNLLGLPLDLATINLARGRDTGVPSLNATRAQFYQAANQDSLLKPYESWVDFAAHLKHEASIINFVAAYGTHSMITSETTVAGKRDAALAIITNTTVNGRVPPADRQAFLNGSDAYAGGAQAAGKLGGLNNVDLWIGGLAEQIMPFGGMLGSTFNFVFETQMEKLQSGDRFYYLQRLDGLHLFGEMENNSFAAMIMRNTDATHLPSDVFSTPGLILEIDQTKQYNAGLGETAGADGVLADDPDTPVDESADNLGNDPTGGSLLSPLVIRDNPVTSQVETNYLKYTGGDHVVLGGTNQNDTLIASIGDDTLYGDGGNDRLEGGFGNDIINGGDGDDIIVDSGGDDNIKSGKGHDVVHAGPGLDLVMGNDGQDFIFLGTDMGSEVFAGRGNDFIYGNKNAERILGNEGDDWIETGTFDGAPGDNFDEVFAHDGIDGNDVFLGDGGFDEYIGEGGDDIMVGSPGRGKMAGMSGYDWATYKDNTMGVNADLSRPIVFDEAPTLPQNASLDEYASMEGLSGSRFNDVLKGSEASAEERLPSSQGGTEGYLGSYLDAQGIALIKNLQDVLGAGVSFFSGDIILGGDGSDVLQGNGGDDILDGDKWLNVRIGIMQGWDENGPIGVELAGNPNIKSMTSLVTLRLDAAGNVVTAETGGTAITKPLSAWMFEGKINPGQLQIIREITTSGADATADTDIAAFRGARGEYAFSATADGQVVVTHAIENAIDGTDRLRNIEQITFSDNNPLNIIVGTPGNDATLNGTAQDDLILGLAGADTLNGGAGNDILVGGPGTNTASATDNFSGGYGGGAGFVGSWTESNDTGGFNGGAGQGQIRITNGVLVFGDSDSLNNGVDSAQIQRTLNLAGATSATISYNVTQTGFDAGETVTVLFSPNGSAPWQTVQTINGSTASGLTAVNLTGPFTATAVIRFEVAGGNANSITDLVTIDNLAINFTNPSLNSGVDTLNGGTGDDTYSFGAGDGNDLINEFVATTSPTAGGTADRISILAPNAVDASGVVIIDPVTGLATPTLSSLSAVDSNPATNTGDLVISYGMPTGATTSVTQTITVAGHYNGTNAETGVERINFNGASVYGYALGADDYLISRADPATRTSAASGVNLAASLVANFIAGEAGVDDAITGGTVNDLIFGGTGDNDLVGGAGDDLLVGGADDDEIDTRLNATSDDFAGAVGADIMVGGGGNDVYGVDDLADVVVEAANQGTDRIETFLTALSLETMANVENLTYRGADGGAFTGTGNGLNNVINGGDLNDTLSGLAGNDTLDGGLGADTLIGGDGNDVFVVDDAGDVVTEANADLAVGGTDRVEAFVSYTLGANAENLDLNGAAVRGTGNALNNVINGNANANELFGGAGNDTIDGGDGSDLVDGGEGNDTLSGGAGGDADTIIGGVGNDTIEVGSGNDIIRYTAADFGADTINNFDSVGGSAATQDLIDLSALGVTAANFATRVTIADIEDGGVDDTLITVRDAAGATLGTIRLEEVEATGANGVTAADFILAAAAPTTPVAGATAGPNTINGTAADNLINGLGGNDTLNGLGGNDTINGGEGADTLNGGDGNDTLSGGIGSDTGIMGDNFSTVAYNNSTGTIVFPGNWAEGGGETTNPTAGDITVSGGRLQFNQGVDGGETIERAIDLAGATAATVSFAFEDDNLGAGQSVIVQARNVLTNAWETLTGGTLGSTTNNGNGTFTATLSASQIGANSAIRFLTAGDGNNWDIGDNFFIDNFALNVTRPNQNAGVDTLNGDAGDDTIIWNANGAGGITDGRDLVNGGTEGAAGDTFVINGNASAEVYRIYARAEALAAGLTIATSTEIVVTRNGTDNASIIAELDEIEEIRINGFDPAGTAGTAGDDTFEIIGDFSQTDLRLNTITIDGQAGDDIVDISALASAHRIVFRSNGGNDTIVGTLRSQDVIELPEGTLAADFEESTDANGLTTLSDGTHTIRFVANGSPQLVEHGYEDGDHDGHDDEDDEDEHESPDHEDEEDEEDHGSEHDDDEDCGSDEDEEEDEDNNGGPSPLSGSGHLVGTASADVLVGTSAGDLVFGFAGTDYIVAGGGADIVRAGEGDDFVSGQGGNDVLWGDDGDDDLLGDDGNDIIDGEEGDDNLFGGSGNDLLSGGAGGDTVFGGAGNDLFKGSLNDGNDTYYGGEMGEDSGLDTLDLGFLTGAVVVDLGSGVGGRGSAVSSQGGTDTLWGVENVVTGAGADTITMSNAVNIVDGGAGNDVFVFGSAAAAHGDTIRNFQTGDRIDLSGIDANSTVAGNQSFQLVAGQASTAPGQIVVTHETREDGEYTIVSGNTAGADNAPEFRISLSGNHTLSGSDFNL
jgi:Ca2+-binding RTX toxin-like protein